MKDPTDPQPDHGWRRLITAFFTTIFHFGTVKVAHLGTHYASLWSLLQGPIEMEQAFMQRVVWESKSFPFVEKECESLIKERFIESMFTNVLALLGVSEEELTVMLQEDLLATMKEKHSSK